MSTFKLNPSLIVVIVLGTMLIAAGLLFGPTSPGGTDPSTAQNTGAVTKYIPPKPIAIQEISNHASNVPPPIRRTTNETVSVVLDAVQAVAEIDDGITYEYWTFNRQVPGPFIRVMEGDTVEVTLTHSHDHTAYNPEEEDPEGFFDSFSMRYMPFALAQEHEHALETSDDHSHAPAGIHAMPDGMVMTADGVVLDDAEVLPDGSIKLGTGEVVGGGDMTAEEHTAAGHGEHSIDLHAAEGALGGADYIRTGPNESRTFQFKALKPGIYIYHCGSPHVATHVANGMYGMILVEPKGGLPEVDKEFYIMQGELYTHGETGDKGHQEFSLEKLLDEAPEYVPFNGRMGALDGDRALRAEVGDTVRVFFGSSGQLISSFHIIGEIFDKVYREGDLISPPARNVQTTLVPAGGAMMTEFTVDVPGTYLMVDHALGRALNKGAHAQLVVTGAERPDLISSVDLE